MTFEEYKQQLLDYLYKEKELSERDIRNHQDLSDEEKVEQGYLIKGCHVSANVDDSYTLTAEENNTKLRAGDRVLVTKEGSKTKIKATIVENFFNTISVTPEATLETDAVYDIHVTEAVFLDSMIALLERMEDGDSGTFYIKELCKLVDPDKSGYGAIDITQADIPEKLNEAQRSAVEKTLNRPSLYCIQGPPGTGKTDVLSTIAKNFSEKGKEVLIISNTHQAVNNALNKIVQYNVPIVKIGETLKAQELSDSIQLAKTYNAYLRTRRRRRRGDKGAIVGMTLHASINNLCLRTSGFTPSVVLVDEAGQIPLVFGASLGAVGAGSIIFIGDDRQMPPIFHPEMTDEPMSVSIFTHVSRLYPDFKTVLNTTYRMNTEISDFVSVHFYEPYGITLKSFRTPKYDKSIEFTTLLSSDDNMCEEYNPQEALIASNKAYDYVMQDCSVAIVTPFRKQVNCIREHATSVFAKHDVLDKLPLIDTVERLQGQDVDVIIISTAVSSLSYYQQVREFVMEPHRLNVMFSRAKDKVEFIHNEIVQVSH